MFDNADAAVAFNVRCFHLLNIIHTVLAQMPLQFCFGQEFPTHVSSQHLAIADNEQGLGLNKSCQVGELVTQVVQCDVPEDDGNDQDEPISN